MELIGLVDRISYQSPDNSFAVIRLREKRTNDPFVAVGPLAGLSVGQYVKLIGNWDTHPKYGLRFKAEGYVPEVPSLPEDIERYLGSGAVKGIGPVTAKRIVERFGEKSLEVMEQEPDLLLQVKGISPRRLKGILDSWEAQKDLKELLLFLKRFDLPTGLAFKLKKYYKEAALSIITQDPYRLAMEVSGIGFLRADAIAKRLGHAKDSPSRFKA
ncbi:MAG: helix-hairpin-helix domain-containing protein, partial [Desulfatiglandales bacterium]